MEDTVQMLLHCDRTPSRSALGNRVVRHVARCTRRAIPKTVRDTILQGSFTKTTKEGVRQKGIG